MHCSRGWAREVQRLSPRGTRGRGACRMGGTGVCSSGFDSACGASGWSTRRDHCVAGMSRCCWWPATRGLISRHAVVPSTRHRHPAPRPEGAAKISVVAVIASCDLAPTEETESRQTDTQHRERCRLWCGQRRDCTRINKDVYPIAGRDVTLVLRSENVERLELSFSQKLIVYELPGVVALPE